jgi:hypothetical protein
MKIPAALGPAFCLLLLALPFGAAGAGEFSAVLNGKSFHIGAEQDWNEDNYGLGIEYEFATESRWKPVLMANGFRDSNDQMSYMAGGGLHRNLYSTERLNGFYVDAGVNVFLMTRQDVNDNRPFPGMLPSLTVGNDHVGLNLSYLPRKAVEKLLDTSMGDDSISGIVFLQFKVSVNPD